MLKVTKKQLHKTAKKIQRDEEKERQRKFLDQDFPQWVYETIQTIEYSMRQQAAQGKFSCEVTIEKDQYPTLANIFKDFNPTLDFEPGLDFYVISLKW